MDFIRNYLETVSAVPNNEITNDAYNLLNIASKMKSNYKIIDANELLKDPGKIKDGDLITCGDKIYSYFDSNILSALVEVGSTSFKFNNINISDLKEKLFGLPTVKNYNLKVKFPKKILSDIFKRYMSELTNSSPAAKREEFHFYICKKYDTYEYIEFDDNTSSMSVEFNMEEHINFLVGRGYEILVIAHSHTGFNPFFSGTDRTDSYGWQNRCLHMVIGDSSFSPYQFDRDLPASLKTKQSKLDHMRFVFGVVPKHCSVEQIHITPQELFEGIDEIDEEEQELINKYNTKNNERYENTFITRIEKSPFMDLEEHMYFRSELSKITDKDISPMDVNIGKKEITLFDECEYESIGRIDNYSNNSNLLSTQKSRLLYVTVNDDMFMQDEFESGYYDEYTWVIEEVWKYKDKIESIVNNALKVAGIKDTAKLESVSHVKEIVDMSGKYDVSFEGISLWISLSDGNYLSMKDELVDVQAICDKIMDMLCGNVMISCLGIE